jgi:Tol biopolymer transport system component
VSTKDGEKSARQFTVKGGRGPAWSPDGNWIAFGSNRPSVDYYGRSYALFLKSVRGGPVIKVTDGKTNDFNAEWSPDGKSVVVGAESKPDQGFIAIVDVRAIVK